MKPRILFTHSYFMQLDPKQWAAGQPYAPLGTLYAAAILRDHGYDAALFDTMFEPDPRNLLKTIEHFKPDIFVIYDDGFNYLTKMCLTNMRAAAFTMARLAKQKDCVVIVSSSDATDHYQLYLEEGADFVIAGEAEISLLELVNAVATSQDSYHMINGLIFKEQESIIKTPARSLIRDLDELPFPAWDLVDINKYRSAWMKSSGYFSMNMTTTRGCPFKCNWCAKPIYGNRYHSRSPEQVVTELKMLQEKYEFDHIWFCDDIFGLKPGWVSRFATVMTEAGLRFRFKIQSRADLLVQENYVQALSDAGCENVWMGAESGSQAILDAMDKGITVEQIAKATGLLKEHGIKPSFFIQFGYLGETKKDIDRTINMINRLLPYSIGISVSYPLPGTLFYEKVKAGMTTKTNWTDSDELELMFRNTYKPEFYKRLHRYVHKSHRSHVASYHIRKLLKEPFTAGFTACKKAASWLYYYPASLIAKQKLNRLEKACMQNG